MALLPKWPPRGSPGSKKYLQIGNLKQFEVSDSGPHDPLVIVCQYLGLIQLMTNAVSI